RSAPLFFSAASGDPPDLPSFPTRRSSDLRRRGVRGPRDLAPLRVEEPQRRAGQLHATQCRVHDLDQQPLAAGLFPRVHLVEGPEDRKSTRLNSSHVKISYAVFCLKKKNRK